MLARELALLVIRDAQMVALNRHALRQYCGQAAAFLRTEAPEVFADASDPEIDAFVRRGLERARSHGITDGHYAEQYLLYMAWVGPDFDTAEPWAAAILGDAGASEPEKIGRLEEYILHEWEGSASCP